MAGKIARVSEGNSQLSVVGAAPGGVSAGAGYRAAKRRVGAGIRSRPRARTAGPPSAPFRMPVESLAVSRWLDRYLGCGRSCLAVLAAIMPAKAG